MDESKREPNPAIEHAIAAQSAPKQVNLTIQLGGGRVAVVSAPVPISSDDAVRIMAAFGGFFIQNFDAEQKATAGGRIVLPT